MGDRTPPRRTEPRENYRNPFSRADIFELRTQAVKDALEIMRLSREAQYRLRTDPFIGPLMRRRLMAVIREPERLLPDLVRDAEAVEALLDLARSE